MEEDIKTITLNKIQAAHDAIFDLNALSDEQINKALKAVASAIIKHEKDLFAANLSDLQKMDRKDYRFDRLQLTGRLLRDIKSSIESIAMLPSPINNVLDWGVRSNGMVIRKVSVPLGVIGIVYEARPNVTFDVFSLCFKSGNVCLLKGSKDAFNTNKVIVDIIKDTISKQGINPNVIELLPPDHEAMDILITADDKVDLVIPRGSSGLIQAVRNNSKVPVIETGAGICHTYFDKSGNVKIGAQIINNGKTRRVSVCNALDTLLINEERLDDLRYLCEPLIDSKVKLIADPQSYEVIEHYYPSNLLRQGSVEQDAHTEYLSYAMNVFTVKDVAEAVKHINAIASRHSESIITEDAEAAAYFQKQVDASCVYVNLPTSFTDGGQFGLGAEIGISTQKLHARGPMGLEALTTYKWLINGEGQIRE